MIITGNVRQIEVRQGATGEFAIMTVSFSEYYLNEYPRSGYIELHGNADTKDGRIGFYADNNATRIYHIGDTVEVEI